MSASYRRECVAASIRSCRDLRPYPMSGHWLIVATRCMPALRSCRSRAVSREFPAHSLGLANSVEVVRVPLTRAVPNGGSPPPVRRKPSAAPER